MQLASMRLDFRAFSFHLDDSSELEGFIWNKMSYCCSTNEQQYAYNLCLQPGGSVRTPPGRTQRIPQPYQAENRHSEEEE